MTNKNDLPHGLGRAININNEVFIDGQWNDGERAGFSRFIY